MKRNAFLSIRTQYDNLGDALIVRELVLQLAARSTVTLGVRGVPVQFLKTLDLPSDGRISLVHWPRVLIAVGALLARLGGSDSFLFLIPGGINGEKGRLEYLKGLVGLSIFWLISILGVKICQVGFSYERIGHRHARLLRARSRILYANMPRDRGSQQYAERIGVKTNGLMPDLAFALFGRPRPPRHVNERRVCLSFRVDKVSGLRSELLEVCDRIEAAFDPDVKLLFVAQVGRDAVFMRELSAQVGARNPGRCEFVDCSTGLERAFSVYDECELVISNRLHVLLLGAYCGAVPIGLVEPSLDAKIVGVFEEIGLAKNIVTLAENRKLTEVLVQQNQSFDGAKLSHQVENVFDRVMGR